MRAPAATPAETGLNDDGPITDEALEQALRISALSTPQLPFHRQLQARRP
ncbi:MAG: hypothetical protein ACRBN8_40660 [Nannocystales bacterium]